MKRIATITGDAITTPSNFLYSMGTPYEQLVEAAGGFKVQPQKLVSGGPMMGFAIFGLDVPTTKTTSSLLCLGKDEVAEFEPLACISCGRCVEACPEKLIPSRLAKFSEHGQKDEFERWHGLECIECGSCSYVCPSRRQVAQSVKTMKKLVLADKRKKNKRKRWIVVSEKYQVSSSPHVRAKDSTSRVMLYVIIALLPATLFGIWNFGMHALLLILVTIASCLASEWIFDKIVHKKQPAGSECGCHRTSSGTEPAGRTSMVEAVIGSVFAIVIVKMMFGGLGQNFMNPALGGRCFLLIAFAADMTNFKSSKFDKIFRGNTTCHDQK